MITNLFVIVSLNFKYTFHFIKTRIKYNKQKGIYQSLKLSDSIIHNFFKCQFPWSQANADFIYYNNTRSILSY